MTMTATDLFAGAGGSSIGLAQAGYRIDVAANHWPTSVATHAANHPNTEHYTANLTETDFRTFPRTDVLWASPSCVWHARAGGRKKPTTDVERLRADPGSVDRATAFAVVAAAEVHAYEAVIVENVREFQDWVLFDGWLDLMHRLGYRSQVTVLDSAAVGDPVPQHRMRLYTVFTRAGNVDLDPGAVPLTTASTILDAHPGRLVTRRLYVSDQIDQITEAGPHLVTFRKHAKPRRADQHALATITAGGNHHGVATVTEDGQHFRMLNNRECARGQGFPDSYEFHGTAAEVKAQIGNAVSVNVARWLGQQVRDALERAA